MSFLDLDEWLIDLAALRRRRLQPAHGRQGVSRGRGRRAGRRGGRQRGEPGDDPTRLRARSKVLVSFGDCAVTGNVTALRNPLGVALEVLRPVYLEPAT